MDSLNDDHLVDPPDSKPPCECSVDEAKHFLRVEFDDIMAEAGLEFADGISVAEANKQIDDLIDRLVAPVGSCADCKPEKGD